MKKIILVISVFALYICGMVLLMKHFSNKEKFIIIDNRGNYYYTNDTIIENSKCVSFMDSKNNNIKICGSYTIKERE